MEDLSALLKRQEFPRSSRYDPEWVLENQMGPNALWLVEWLAERLPLSPGMRVLDLGCGRALSSIFLAKEFQVRVWATDWWISPDHNWRRACEAGVGELVCPQRAEAHALPFARGFFDAAVSIDAYHYFGTDALYLGYLSGLVRPGGAIGVVVPALTRDFDGEVPEHLRRPQSNGKRFWEDECWSFKTAEWWRTLWSRSHTVTQVHCDTLPEGWRHWREFEKAVELSGRGAFPSDAETLERDQGRYLGFARVVAQRTDAEATEAYDPTVGLRAGVDA